MCLEVVVMYRFWCWDTNASDHFLGLCVGLAKLVARAAVWIRSNRVLKYLCDLGFPIFYALLGYRVLVFG